MADPFIVWEDDETNPKQRLVLVRGASVSANKWTVEEVTRVDAMGIPVWSTVDKIEWPMFTTILNGVIPAASA